MNCCILMGSPRPTGNTHSLLTPFIQELEQLGHHCTVFPLYEMDLRPCTACRRCQMDWTAPACAQDDDLGRIAQAILDCDLILLATPIYSWYCTPPMKAVLDRLVYAMNKFYGSAPGPALWAGKHMALITTCGYRPEKGSDLLEEGLRRYCKHSRLNWLGALAERHLGYDIPFMDGEKEARARAFARQLAAQL
jgi:multimeric flavodoxin WrbA